MATTYDSSNRTDLQTQRAQLRRRMLDSRPSYPPEAADAAFMRQDLERLLPALDDAGVAVTWLLAVRMAQG
jgi:hypothetical protein